jgi:predicted membrane protein
MFLEQYTTYLALIIFLVGMWIAGRSKKISMTALFFLISGMYFFLQSFFTENFALWPLLLILLLAFIVLNVKFSFKFENFSRKKFNGNPTNNFNENITGQFYGKKISGIVTGGKLNLKSATLPPNGSTLYIDFIMGKYEVNVPEEWDVKVDFEKITGKIEDNRSNIINKSKSPILYISGKTIIGELEIN